MLTIRLATFVSVTHHQRWFITVKRRNKKYDRNEIIQSHTQYPKYSALLLCMSLLQINCLLNANCKSINYSKINVKDETN